MRGRNMRRVSHGCHYFFVRPGRNGNVHKAAARLMRIGKVREVAITEGDYGFVVKAHGVEDDDKAVTREIAKVVGGSSRKAVCHCRYIRS